MREAQGDALVRRGDFGAAIAEYREAIRLDPELGSAHASLGSALAHQGEPEQALAAFRDASRLEPHNAGVWLQLSHLYEVSGRGADALRSLEMGVEANPDDAGLLNQVAWLLATAEDPALRDPAKALGYAQRAVAASGGADANILDTLAEAHFANGEFAEAIEVEERALAIAPGIEVFHDQLEKFRAAAGSR